MRDAGDTASTSFTADRLLCIAAFGQSLLATAILGGAAGRSFSSTVYGFVFAACCLMSAVDSLLTRKACSHATRVQYLPFVRVAVPSLMFVPANALLAHLGVISDEENFLALTWVFPPVMMVYCFASHHVIPRDVKAAVNKDELEKEAVDNAVPDVAVPLLFLRLYLFFLAIVFIKKERAQMVALALLTSAAALFCMSYDKTLIFSPYMSRTEVRNLAARTTFLLSQARCVELFCSLSIAAMGAQM